MTLQKKVFFFEHDVMKEIVGVRPDSIILWGFNQIKISKNGEFKIKKINLSKKTEII